jgi:cytochrome c biogenesis protein CcmG/thiol:disulfide interchange protein DsbE
MMRIVILSVAATMSACGESSARSSGDKADSMASSLLGTARVEIGSPLPQYSAKTLSGELVEVGGRGGPLTLVNVWATWCTSCREEMQDLAAIHRDYGARGLRVVAVSVDAGSERLVRRVVDRDSLTFPVVHDQAGIIQKRYGVVGVPTSYLIGSDGLVLWQQVGGIHGNLPKVRVAVERALQQ